MRLGRTVEPTDRATQAQTPVSLGLANQDRQAYRIALSGHWEPDWKPLVLDLAHYSIDIRGGYVQ